MQLLPNLEYIFLVIFEVDKHKSTLKYRLLKKNPYSIKHLTKKTKTQNINETALLKL